MLNPKTNKLTSAYHRRLFECYLKHVIEYDKPHHLLWGQMNAIYEASRATFVDALALTLSVAIEALLSSEFPKLGVPTSTDIRHIKELQQYVKDWNGDLTIKNRIEGSISQMCISRPGDKLLVLIRKGAITKNQYEHWKKLRNTSAHSYQRGSVTGQELVALVHHVQMLYYHLVFHAIGYRGLYLDFDTLGWPIKYYP